LLEHSVEDQKDICSLPLSNFVYSHTGVCSASLTVEGIHSFVQTWQV